MNDNTHITQRLRKGARERNIEAFSKRLTSKYIPYNKNNTFKENGLTTETEAYFFATVNNCYSVNIPNEIKDGMTKPIHLLNYLDIMIQ